MEDSQLVSRDRNVDSDKVTSCTGFIIDILEQQGGNFVMDGWSYHDNIEFSDQLQVNNPPKFLIFKYHAQVGQG